MATDTAETFTIDRLDRQLIHALSVDGRTPFRRIAAVLGSSEQTVARRYRRLREAGVLRVVVLPDARRFAHNWWLRIQMRPAATLPFAEALARRPDVSWVTLTSGGTEIICAVRARTSEQRDALLLERLPRSSHVLGVSATAILHVFADGPDSEWRGLDDHLTAAQTAALDRDRGARRRPIAGPDPLPEDEPLLAELARDGRASYAALATATGWSEVRVRRRVNELLDGGALVIDIELARQPLGFATSAMLALTVAPGELDRVGRILSRHPEVPFVSAVTGRANLLLTVICRDTDALYRYLTERIGAIEGIRDVDVSLELRRLKQAGTTMVGERLPDPLGE